MKISTQYNWLIILPMLLMVTACDDFIKVDPPRTDLVNKTVFAEDATAEAAMTEIYARLYNGGFASGSSFSVSLLTSFSSDEQEFYAPNSDPAYLQFSDNTLDPSNPYIDLLWSDMYTTIYRVNAVIEGVSSSTTLSEVVKNQLLGEALFLRAFTHFYLVNLWGDVPLILTTNYKTNNTITRTPAEIVYEQIIIDLKAAQELLPLTYDYSRGERVRANQWVVAAFLARVYLYTEKWSEAEAASSKVIQENTLFSLESDLVNVFRGTSPEAIFQLWSTDYPADRNSFTVYDWGPTFGSLRQLYVDSFEEDDQRWAVWGRTAAVGDVSFPYELKYLDFSTPPLDYTTIIRLSELYLIRAEVRIHLDDFAGAVEDINIIRARAGLSETTSGDDNELMEDIIRERKSEFVNEWGHRWFDLKRWHLVDETLTAIKPEWNFNDQLYPIPQTQILNNPDIQQNPR